VISRVLTIRLVQRLSWVFAIQERKKEGRKEIRGGSVVWRLHPPELKPCLVSILKVESKELEMELDYDLYAKFMQGWRCGGLLTNQLQNQHQYKFGQRLKLGFAKAHCWKGISLTTLTVSA